MNDVNEWYTVTKASEQVDIPGETVRRYVRQYGDFLYMKRGEKRAYLIHESSLDTLKKIRYLLEQDYTREQIDDILQQTEQVTIQADDGQMNEYLMNLPQLHRETEKHIRQLSEQLEQQNNLIKNLSQQVGEQQEQLKQQQEYIQTSLDERDQKLMNVMNEIAESKKEVAAEKEQQKEKQGFWSRLFKGSRDND